DGCMFSRCLLILLISLQRPPGGGRALPGYAGLGVLLPACSTQNELLSGLDQFPAVRTAASDLEGAYRSLSGLDWWTLD
ncbi:MAG: hypothetical protein AAGD13_23310, partial [Pseudomonadota bacterium]